MDFEQNPRYSVKFSTMLTSEKWDILRRKISMSCRIYLKSFLMYSRKSIDSFWYPQHLSWTHRIWEKWVWSHFQKSPRIWRFWDIKKKSSMTVKTDPEELRVLQNNIFLVFYILTVGVLRWRVVLRDELLRSIFFMKLESMDFKLFKTVPESVSRNPNQFLQH